MRRGKTEDAYDVLHQLVRLDPQFAYAHHLLGVCLLMLNQQVRARPMLQRAVELDPSDALAHYNLGVAASLRGDAKAAEEAFRAALAVDPELRRAQEAIEEPKAPARTEEVPEGGWVPLLDEPGKPKRYGPALVIPPNPFPEADESVRVGPDGVALTRPLSALSCLRIGIASLSRAAGDAGIITMAFLGIVIGMWASLYLLEAALGFLPGIGAIAAPVAMLVLALFAVVGLIIFAGYVLVGVMLADTRLFGTDPPGMGDLWAGFDDWGLTAGAAFGKALVWAPAFVIVTTVGTASASVALSVAALVLTFVPTMYVATRLKFVTHLIDTTDTELFPAFRESWDLTAPAQPGLLAMSAIDIALAGIGPALAAVGFIIGDPTRGITWALIGAGSVLTLFTLPISAASTGVAFRVLYERKYPGSGPE